MIQLIIFYLFTSFVIGLFQTANDRFMKIEPIYTIGDLFQIILTIYIVPWIIIVYIVERTYALCKKISEIEIRRNE